MGEKFDYVVNALSSKEFKGVSLVLLETKSLGHPIRYFVPGSSTDFNKLDTKRMDAANIEACANIVYRSMNPDFRTWFLHGREAKPAENGESEVTEIVGIEEEVLGWDLSVPSGFTFKDKSPVDSWARATKVAKNAKGEVRMKDGEPVETYDNSKETEENYYDRVIAMSVAAKKFASEDAARAHWQPLAERIALEVEFDPEAAPKAAGKVLKLAAKYKITAAVLITRGTVDAFMEKQYNQVKEGTTWTASGDTTKMFTGKAVLPKTGEELSFNVSEKDAESLGRLVKEFSDWRAQQAQNELVA